MISKNTLQQLTRNDLPKVEKAFLEANSEANRLLKHNHSISSLTGAKIGRGPDFNKWFAIQDYLLSMLRSENLESFEDRKRRAILEFN